MNVSECLMKCVQIRGPSIPVAEVVLEVVPGLLDGRDAVHEVVRALAPDFGHHGVRSRGVADQRGQDGLAGGREHSSENKDRKISLLNKKVSIIHYYLLDFFFFLYGLKGKIVFFPLW